MAGRDVGRRLHDSALRHLQDAGFRVVVLWVLERKMRARSMYERWGWRATPARRTVHLGVSEVCLLRML